MIALLYNLPDLGVAILFVSVTSAAFVVAPLLRRRLFGQVSQAESEIARSTIVTITSITGVVLAFSLVQAQGNLRSVQQIVADESIQLNQMDRLLTRYGEAKVAAIRKTLDAYAESIVVDEWPKLSEHSRSQRTADLFRTISASILAIRPAPGRETVMYADLVRITDQLAESRENRLIATDLGLQPIFWGVILALMLVMIGFAAFVEPRRGEIVSLAGLGVGLALLTALVFIFDQPFLGDVSVTPDPIAHVLTVMRARTS